MDKKGIRKKNKILVYSGTININTNTDRLEQKVIPQVVWDKWHWVSETIQSIQIFSGDNTYNKGHIFLGRDPFILRCLPVPELAKSDIRY